MAVARVTVPVKLFSGATVTLDVAPPLAATDVGLAEMLKSGGFGGGVTTTATVAELVIVPVAVSVPVIVAV